MSIRRSGITAVIPNWNRADLLRTLLDSCAAQTRPFDELIVVDGASADNSVAVGEQAGARVVRLTANLGFAAAVNRGIELARSEWVAVLNNDVTLEPDWVATIVEAAEREDAWFAAGKVLRADNAGVIDATFDAVSRGACAWRCGSGRKDGEVWNRARRIRMAPMTAAAFRRTLFEDVGLLEERFESYMEDVEFGLRCSAADRGGVYVPEAVAHHLGSATLGRWNKDTVRLIGRNQVLLAAKHFRGEPRWPLVAGQLLWGFVAIRHACGIAWLRGKVSGYRMARGWRSEQKQEHTETLRAIIESSERDIYELQQQTGFDGYWRAYFWLLRR
ncbi:MAG TPA: glycosyltransferase family 2 protein [Bryobacteraceae bacterium]|nr:glycosyltransferase family 2 protein [Bryobacteraceae bacterium]